MRITFQLEPEDIARFHDALDRAERRVACAEECDIVDAARHALGQLPIAAAPGYIRQRLGEASRLLLMIEDEAFALPQPERGQVLRVLAYLGDPEDMIPDHVEVIGLLDDAIMLELLMRRLRHVMQAWEDFRAARAALGEPPAEREARRAWVAGLARRRDALHARMRRRAGREAEGEAGGEAAPAAARAAARG